MNKSVLMSWLKNLSIAYTAIIVLSIALYVGFDDLIFGGASGTARDTISAALAAIFVLITTMYMLNKQTDVEHKKKLVVVDYKAQSSTYPVTVSSYLDAEWHLSYKLQMDIYVHILRKMNFEVSDKTYFYVCNGEKTNDKFDNKIDFKTTLVPYRVNT